MDRRQNRPDQSGDDKVIVPGVEPDGIKDQLDDEGHRQGIYKIQPLESSLVGDQRGDNVRIKARMTANHTILSDM